MAEGTGGIWLGSQDARWRGGEVSPIATCVVADNPGIMTLDGTNTWVLLPPGGRRAVVIDAGPEDDEEHLHVVLAAVAARDAEVWQILLTHRHTDHSGGSARLAALTGAPVRALDPAYQLGDEGLGDGDVIAVDGLELKVLGTPGHSSDSLCFFVDGLVLTGDTVLGRGTAVIAHPDGQLGPYLDSLRRLRDRVDEVQMVLPGHGPVLSDPVGVIEGYLAHRQQRLDQVRVAVAGGATTVDEVVAVVYADVDRVLWPAAAVSVRAQLDFLQGE